MLYRASLLLSSLAFAAAAGATDYAFETIDVPGVDQTFLLDINDSGQWAGYTVTSGGGIGPDLYTAITGNIGSSAVTVLSRTGTLGLGASGINSSGEISGVSVVLNGMAIKATGFVRNSVGGYADIDPASGGSITSAYSEAVDLNDNGMVVGFYDEAQPADEAAASVNAHGFIRKNGVYSTLDYPEMGVGNHGTQLYSVNNSGTVSGRYLDGFGFSHGFHYHSDTGTFEDLNIPGFFSTEGEGLSNNGDYAAVGYLPDSNPSNPFGVLAYSSIHTGGTYVPFMKAGALSTIAYGLNDRGQVVGVYADGNYRFHGFTATPAPEPASLAVLGLGGLAILRRRKKI